jgi:hypothetical protein
MNYEEVRQKLIEASKKWEEAADKDEECMWGYWEAFWAGKKQQAKYIDTFVRPITKANMLNKLDKMTDAVEELCKTRQKNQK